jgi:hypothetical protein
LNGKRINLVFAMALQAVTPVQIGRGMVEFDAIADFVFVPPGVVL